MTPLRVTNTLQRVRTRRLECWNQAGCKMRLFGCLLLILLVSACGSDAVQSDEMISAGGETATGGSSSEVAGETSSAGMISMSGSPGQAGSAGAAGDSGFAADAGSSLPIGTVGNTVCLNADGPAAMDTYELIESVLGAGTIEHPDDDHDPPLRHILEETDEDVGPHFVFLSHSEVDTDRQINFDRCRIEIKTFGPSPENLKGFEGETFTYTWRFKINPDMTFSNRFTHMFQLKAVGGDDSSPLITITGRDEGPAGRLEIIHTGPPSLGRLAEATLTGAKDVWLSVYVQATFSDAGSLTLTIEKPDGSTLISVEENDIDLWRGGDFVRPKWGIYRGLSDQLRPDEERVYFANFAITEGMMPSTDCRQVASR